MRLEVGQVLRGRYKIERMVGRGRAGVVYQARDLRLDRRVAIKVLDAAAEDQSCAHWEGEAKLASSTGNPHILEVCNVLLLPGGLRCMVTEYLEGETLASRMNRGNMTEPEVAAWMVQVLAGLGAVHQAGVCHRHLGPASVFILPFLAGQRDFVKIIDFGLAEPLGTDAEHPTGVDSTPQYLSPEQVLHQCEVDARSNVFSVGVIAYQALTGELPFAAKTREQYAIEVAERTPVPVAQQAPWASAGLGDIVDQALVRQPEARFQSTRAMLAATVNWAQGLGIALAPLDPSEPEMAVPPAPPPKSQQQVRARAAVTSSPSAPPPLPTRPRPTERSAMIVAVHSPRKPHVEEAPAALVVIEGEPGVAVEPTEAVPTGAVPAEAVPAEAVPAEAVPAEAVPTEDGSVGAGAVTPSTDTLRPPPPARQVRRRLLWGVPLLMLLLGVGLAIWWGGVSPVGPGASPQTMRDRSSQPVRATPAAPTPAVSAPEPRRSAEVSADAGLGEVHAEAAEGERVVAESTAGEAGTEPAPPPLPRAKASRSARTKPRSASGAPTSASDKAGSSKAGSSRNPYAYR